MTMYAITNLPLLDTRSKTKKISFADDFSGVGTIQHLREWWDLIEELGPYIGYHPNVSKSTLVAKKQYLKQATMIFSNSTIEQNIEHTPSQLWEWVLHGRALSTIIQESLRI